MEQLWDIIISASFTTVILFIWFETNAFVEYASILDYTCGLATKERNEMLQKYIQEQKLAPSLSFPEFLLSEYPGFLTKLLSCPICLSVWICWAVMLVGSISMLLYPISLIVALFFYFKLIQIANG